MPTCEEGILSMIYKALFILFLVAMPASAQTFSLEPLVDEHKQHVAPPSIQSAMRKIEEMTSRTV